MKPNSHIEITGTVTHFTLESDAQGAVLAAYTEDQDGKVGRSWLRFGPAAVQALKTRAAGLRDVDAEQGASGPHAPRTVPHYTVEPGWVDVDVPGWQLKGHKESGELVDACHELFRPDDHNADIEAAMEWAEQIIGARQEWFHVRERGFDRWETTTRV